MKEDRMNAGAIQDSESQIVNPEFRVSVSGRLSMEG